jgi:hypothetical protein
MAWRHPEPVKLLSDEVILTKKVASVFVKLADYGLSAEFESNAGGEEGIGGELSLTNYRLVFSSYSLNRLAGKFSIFLSAIREAKKTSFLWTRRLEVATQAQTFAFKLRGISDFISSIDSATAAFKATATDELKARLADEYRALGDEFKVSDSKAVKIMMRASAAAQMFKDVDDLRRDL